MASIKKNILGEVRGKVGDKVFKIRDNKGYVASAPSTYSMSNSPSAIANRDIKKVTGKFSSMVYNVEILKKIWENVEIEKYKNKNPTTFNKISGVNFYLCSPGKATEKNKITPNGFELPVKDLKHYEDKVEVTLNVIKKRKKENKFICILLIWCEEPLEKGYADYNHVSMLKATSERIIFEFDENTSKNIKSYRDKIIFLAIAEADSKGKIVSWSSTFAKKINYK